MKIRYFQDTDTLHIEFKPAEVAETRDLDENTLLDMDKAGDILGITVEHASQRTNIPQFSYERAKATNPNNAVTTITASTLARCQ